MQLLPIIYLLGAFFWFSNIFWTISNWSRIDTFEAVIQVLGVFIPPLGSILGLVHIL